jgi:hypothetical protein
MGDRIGRAIQLVFGVFDLLLHLRLGSFDFRDL